MPAGIVRHQGECEQQEAQTGAQHDDRTGAGLEPDWDAAGHAVGVAVVCRLYRLRLFACAV